MEEVSSEGDDGGPEDPDGDEQEEPELGGSAGALKKAPQRKRRGTLALSVASIVTQKQQSAYRRRVNRLRRALVRYNWKQVEDVQAWQRRAAAAEAALGSGGGPEDDDLDISTDNTRMPTATETVEAMIKTRLRAEGYESDEESYNQADGHMHNKLTKKIKLNRPGLDIEAPLKSIEEVEKELAEKVKTKSAQLVRDFWATCDFQKANNGHFLRVHENIVGQSPHKLCTERIKSRYTGYHLIGPEVERECTVPDLSAVPQEVVRVEREEVILTVAVCSQMGHKEQEFDVLASQHLYELRDALYFASDWMYDGPTRIKSGCFFLDGIFYSDTRHPSAVDYSKELLEWLKATREPGYLRADSSKSMEVRFSDMGRIPFGERWVYIHQGDIEQSVYITNARLFHPSNACPFREAYPVLTFMRRFVKRRCMACLKNFAIWQVLDSSRCPHNPSFWCAQCFRHFFQDKDGNYLPPVDYKVFPYLHDET